MITERETIAMELHDRVMPALHGAVLSLRAVERSADTAHVREAVRDVRCQLDTTIKELRQFVLDVAPRSTRRTRLSTRFMRIAREASLTEQVRVQIDIDEAADLVVNDPRLVDQIAAIAREATANVLHHARATSLVLRVSSSADRLILIISDDGRGFGAGAASRPAGRGLVNMARRARLIGGELNVRSELGAGTQVRLELPLGHESSNA